MHRNELFAWIDNYLEVARFRDYSPIGLQVEGSDDITKIALGVSAHLELIEKAVQWGAQAILVHHGFFWPGESNHLVGWRKKRIQTLLANEISLGGYHLPLDAHLEVGNNAILADLLGVPKENRTLFASAKGAPIGLIGKYDTPQPFETLRALLANNFGPRCIIFDAGPPQVTTVGLVTGGGAGYFEEARGLGAEFFVTGEAREPTMAEARETHAHFIAAGHYNTETLGIKALGERIEAQFDVETQFFDIPNPV